MLLNKPKKEMLNSSLVVSLAGSLFRFGGFATFTTQATCQPAAKPYSLSSINN